jgi:hypothetical protein
MKTSLLAIVACWALVGAAVAQEHPGAKPAAAGAGALDGTTFSGELGKSGEKKGDKDELTFKDGKFVSSACVAYGFHETAYTATEKEGVVTFTSTATNAKGETMSWTGTIKQGVLEATAVNKTPAGETTYAFKGKQGATAKAKEHPKKSEHPEHPK